MIVEGDGFKYGLEEKLVKKLNVMIRRCEQKDPKRDAELIIEGGEGEGKTNSALACAYYIKKQTGRQIHLFFSLRKMIDFAQSTEAKIIIWDEPAMDALSTDWYKDTSKDLMRLLMMARKKRHFFIFNFTKFYKFSEYIIVDRGLGMIHMYSRNEITPGRFVYIRRKNLERLYLGYKVSKKRLYKPLTAFRGGFPEVLEHYLTKMDIWIEEKEHATYEDYDKLKDLSIQSIGKTTDNKKNDKQEARAIKNIVATLKLPINTKEELAKSFGLTIKGLEKWSERYKNERKMLENGAFLPPTSPNNDKVGCDDVDDIGVDNG